MIFVSLESVFQRAHAKQLWRHGVYSGMERHSSFSRICVSRLFTMSFCAINVALIKIFSFNWYFRYNDDIIKSCYDR